MDIRGKLSIAPKGWSIIAGMSFMYVWTWLLYWGGPFTLRTYTIELVNARWAANVVACAVMLGVVVLVSCRPSGERLVYWLRLSGLVCGFGGMGLGLLLVLGMIPQGILVSLIALLSGLFTGVCEASLLVLWCTITSSLGIRAALTHNLLSMVVSGTIFLVCNLLPVRLTYVFGMLCPIGGFICSHSFRHYNRSLMINDSDMGAEEKADHLADSAFIFSASPRSAASDSYVHKRQSPRLLRDLIRLKPLLTNHEFLILITISLVFGFSCGFVNASFEVVPREHYQLSCYGVVLGTILAAALSFFTAFLLKMDAWQLVFRTSLPLMGAAYLLFPYNLFWFIGPGLHALGYQFFFITFWSLLGSKQVRHDEPALRSVSLGLFVTETGAALGLGLWMVAFVGVDAYGLRLVSSVAAFFVLVAAVSLERPRFGWGNVRPGARADATPARGDVTAALNRIRVTYSLSPRESDVFELLGRGRNRQFVADELGISLETAKTHTSNVYRKLGIHSQQELLDVVEMTCDALARERQASQG